LGFFAEKYSDENVWYVEKSLSYFSDADKEPDPRDLKGRTWDEVKRRVLASNVLLSGTNVHGFKKEIGDILPAAEIVPTLHYAHRKGKEAEQIELERVREKMQCKIRRHGK
ncbi:MAG: hypothetical protein U9P12_04430, partial [Verrucomicrobiota bacterium]|nr:hypothetical protein [Verrucomicrobiota bacterium]